jgi:UDP-galactopyranose mutase
MARRRWNAFAAWLYTPMAVDLVQELGPRAIVYDCMDELSAFKDAPGDMAAHERELFRCADAVMTGGPSLFAAKKDLHPNVHCFPSSVDVAHFGLAPHLRDADEQAALPHPRLGFYGVIDERMDLGILEALATSHPEWQIVLVGPVVKIDEASLPRHPNLHYVGQRAYGDLPAFLSGWDLCLIPFARNQATRYLSPTKSLEYMAADRPIVSTPIQDVADLYRDIVFLGDGPEAFVRACERALDMPAKERADRRARARQVLRNTSWDETAKKMEAILHRLADAPPPRILPPTPIPALAIEDRWGMILPVAAGGAPA